MSRDQGSMAELAPRRSARANRGHNGRDVQLDRLGEQLLAPTRQKKRPFIPEDGLVLKNNALAPAPKKRRCSNVCVVRFSGYPSTDQFSRRRSNLFIPNPNLQQYNLHHSHVNHPSTTTATVFDPLHLPNKRLPRPLLINLVHVHCLLLPSLVHVHYLLLLSLVCVHCRYPHHLSHPRTRCTCPCHLRISTRIH